MLRRLAPLLLLFLLGASAGVLVSPPAGADDLVGRYGADGVTPQGKAYKGEVQIEQLGSLYVVLWKLADGEAYKGIAIRQGDVLGAAYGGPDAKFGVVVYQVNGGTLTGLWADTSDLKSELGRETLQGDPSLSGTYRITLGQNRDGITNYGGQVAIKRSGDSYILLWPAKPPAIGIGVRIKDLLVVAYSSNAKKLPGVVAYQSTGNGSLSGIWSLAASKQTGNGSFDITPSPKVGREDLTRIP